jgi:small subunit ribosomal protein S9
MVKTKTAETKPAVKKTTTPKVASAPKKVVEKKIVEPKKVVSASDKVVATPRKKAASTPIIGAIGRRKAAVARVWVRRGKGGIAINKQRCSDYFNTDETRTAAVKGLVSCDVLSKYDVIANVNGGGKVAQSEAINLGIARALIKDDEAYRATLRANGSLTVDSRNKERKKPGQKGARAKFQFVKR